jgi:hypothetical protein
MRVRALLCALAFLASGSATPGWENYKPGSLGAIVEAHASEMLGPETDLLSANNFPTRARVFYQGSIRPIPPERLRFLGEYLGKFRNHPEWVPHYAEEILCREGEREIWLPIQSGVLRYLKDEVPAGSAVDLFVTWLGAHRGEAGVDWIFTINEFSVVPESDEADIPKGDR